MAEVTKYELITNNNNNNNNIISDIKTYFSIFKTRKNSNFIYGVVLVFVLFTVFLAFSPSTSPSSSNSPWFVNIFTVNSTSPLNQSDRSNHPSVYSYFFPNSTQPLPSGSHTNATFHLPVSGLVNPEKQANQSSAALKVGYSSESYHKNVTVVVIDDNGTKNSTIAPQIQSNSTRKAGGLGLTSSDSISKNETLAQTALAPQKSTIAPQIQSNSTEKGGGLGLNSSDSIAKNETLAHTASTIAPQIQSNSSDLANGSKNSTIAPQVQSNTTKKGGGLEVNSSDLTVTLSKNDNNKKKNQVENLVGCDLYDGEWVKDESYPLYKPGSCKLVDEQFNCVLNGRPDHDYYKLKWMPKGCSIPRLNGGNMLELLRGKRLVFVGDSLNRNMWESLVCILKNSVKDKTKVYEAFGRHHFRTEASYSFVFKDYNFTVEFFVSPFLVQQWEVKDKSGTTQETLRLDLMVSDADQFKTADYIVFNTGHWWTHDKTSKGEDYYQEGGHIYKQLDVTEAFRRAITTWGRWVDANVDPQKTHVLFRGYSASHFSGGQWNSGGQCDSETEPIRNETYLTEYPLKMKVFESVIKGMKTHVSYLNITRLTDYRKDGHPSVYRKLQKKSPLRYQDCSHWCLPGVPDSWNELLYAELLRKHYIDQQQVNRT